MLLVKCTFNFQCWIPFLILLNFIPNFLYICVCVCVCEKKWVESNRMYIEKVKWKKDMFDDLLIFQHISTSIFFFFPSEYKNILSKLF